MKRILFYCSVSLHTQDQDDDSGSSIPLTPDENLQENYCFSVGKVRKILRILQKNLVNGSEPDCSTWVCSRYLYSNTFFQISTERKERDINENSRRDLTLKCIVRHSFTCFCVCIQTTDYFFCF